MKKRILFVDDEKCVLDGLKRSLHAMRDRWDMTFLASGEEAIAELALRPYDILISDMRMPGMDGSTLLEHVRNTHPDVVRFILSGQAEQEAVVRAIGPTHQYLTKPCQPKLLQEIVLRACTLRDRLSSDTLRSVIGRLTTIPSPSRNLAEISEELLKEEPSLDRIAEIAMKDIGLSCKVLQIMNSSFFGVSLPVDDVKHAICMLGMKRLRPIFLSAGVFCELQTTPQIASFCDDVIENCFQISSIATAIMKFEQPGKDKLANEALLAGLMVDAGKLVLASEFVDEYTSIYGGHIPEGIPNWRREIARFGASHSDVGAYVLGIWGFSDPIVEAVAYHHEPSRCIHRGFSPLTTVHAASAMVEAAAEGNDLLAALDEGYLESLGVANRLDEWRKIAQKIINAGAAA